MDLSFIKKEEPVDYALILSNEDENSQSEYVISNYDADHANSMDAFTIPIIKDETTNNWYNGNDVSHTDVDCLSSDYCPEAEYSDKDANESDDEDVNESEDYWTIKEKSLKSKPSKSKLGTFRCSVCNSTFRKKYLFRLHLKKHKNLSDKECCNICNKFLPTSIMVLHMLLHKGPPFCCTICGKKFTNKYSFRGHRKVHQEKKYECDMCHKFFLTKGLIKSHIETHIDRKKSFQCHICTVALFRKNTLLRHIRTIHSTLPRKKFRCPNPVCNQQYARIESLKNHKCKDIEKSTERTKIKRKAEKNVKCSQCKRTFLNESKMQLHVERCHSEKKSRKLALHCDV